MRFPDMILKAIRSRQSHFGAIYMFSSHNLSYMSDFSFTHERCDMYVIFTPYAPSTLGGVDDTWAVC